MFLLNEAFKYSGQSTLQLEARETGDKFYKPFLREVVFPQSHRITSLLLDVAGATFRAFLLLPSSLFGELECIKLHIPSSYGHFSVPQAPVTVFQGAPRLRRVTIPLLHNHSPLDLTLPWGQLTYLAFTPGDIELTDSFKVLSLCTNLCECHLCLFTDSEPPITVFHPASVQLPHLRKLGLNMIFWGFSYADFFRPLVIPKLELFTFVLSSSSEDCLNDLRETIDHLSIPGLRLELHYDGCQADDILRLAHSLPPLTSIKAYKCFLPASTIALIGQKTCFQTLTSLEIITSLHNTRDLVEMFKAHWARARQSNNTHPGIRFATIEATDPSEKDISHFSQDIAVIQKQMGVTDMKITLRRWCSSDPWRF